MKDKKARKLTIKTFHIQKIVMGEKTGIKEKTLTVSTENICRAWQKTDIIHSLSVNVIEPHNRSIFVNTIMDFIPISCKVLGKIGEGITHTLTGVYAMICARDESGRQMAAFGSSHGILKDHVKWDKPGTPGSRDLLLHMDVILRKKLPFTKQLPNTVMQVSEVLLQEIREVLKNLDGRNCQESHDFLISKEKDKKK